jgi:hypothetical protein
VHLTKPVDEQSLIQLLSSSSGFPLTTLAARARSRDECHKVARCEASPLPSCRCTGLCEPLSRAAWIGPGP